MAESYVAKLRDKIRRMRPFVFYIDIGATLSFIGRRDLNLILNFASMHHRSVRPSQNRFRFANAVYDFLRKISVPLMTPLGIPKVRLDEDIVAADVPVLLGMDAMDKKSRTPCTLAYRLAKRINCTTHGSTEIFNDEWYIPLTRFENNQLYAELSFPPKVLCTRTPLYELYLHFFHRSAQKLFNLFQRARPEQATPATLQIRRDISKRCDPCQRIQFGPSRFRVTLGPENVCFNERIIFDITSLNDDIALHICDDGTHVSAAQFLPDEPTATVR